MSAPPPKKSDEEEASGGSPPGKGRKKMLMFAAIPVVLLLAGGGLWFSGVLSGLFGAKKTEQVHADAAAKPGPPSYVDLPEMVANLNGVRKPAYIKVIVRIEVPKAEDVEKVKAATPRLQDMFQTYMREIRPEELRGSAGTYRLREELIARANIAVAPGAVSDVLFTQMLVQ